MDMHEAAKQLNGAGCLVRPDAPAALVEQMKAAGLVAVLAVNGDRVDLCGAITDDEHAFDGSTIYVTRAGLLRDRRHKDAASAIYVRWGWKSRAWQYKTRLPHATFRILDETGDLHTEGIVFALADAKP